MSTEKSESSHKLVPMLVLVLTVLFLLALLSLLMTGGTIGAIGLASEAEQEWQTVVGRALGSTGEDVPLVGAGGWARASVEVSNAPDDVVVSSVRVKYHVFSEPSDLEVQLLTSGAETSYTLWNKQNAQDTVLAQSTEELFAFQGVPVNGTWSLAVRGGDAEGYIDDFSVVVYYEIEMPSLRIEGGVASGTPGFLRLPQDAAPAILSPDRDEMPDAAVKAGSSVVPQEVPPGAIIIKTEDFEGSFPNEWQVFDFSDDGHERYWDDASCDACGGDWAAWPADGGADAIWPCSPNDYPNNMYTWMIYGPFDLSDASNAGTEFGMWHNIETDYDWAFFGASDDGSNFGGWYFDGYNDCTLWSSYYADRVGDSSVWVAWAFYSDQIVTYEGPWVDDIVIWKEIDCATVRIDSPEMFAEPGYLFTVDVAIGNAIDLGAFEFELTYDSTCVEAIDATLEPFLGSSGRGVADVGPTYGSGSVTYGGYSWGAAAGPDGDGVLAAITFRAGTNECCSELHLQNVQVTDTGGNTQCAWTEDGSVCVTPIPTPTSTPTKESGPTPTHTPTATPTATPTFTPPVIYLPVVLKNFVRYASPCSTGNDYCEDYDTHQAAYGPLEPGVAYRAYPEDEKDYYYFLVLESASITVRVTNYWAVGQLIVRDEGLVQIGRDVEDPINDRRLEVVLSNLAPGKYYVQLYTGSAYYHQNNLYELTMHK